MTPQQKRILLILGGVDLLVILLLGSFVVHSMRTPPAAPPIATVAPCAQRLLDAYPASAHPQVSWSPEVLRLDLTAPPLPGGSRQDGALPSEGALPLDGAQYLWAALDTLPPHLDAACPPPMVVILSVTVSGEVGAPSRHIVKLQGEDIVAWARGALREDALAARARYRGPAP